MLRLAVALGYLMTFEAQIRFFLEDIDMRLTVQHLIGKDNGVYPCHACNRGGSYDSGLQTETSQARFLTELGISTSESSRIESTMKQSTTETSWSSSTQTTSSDSTEFSTTSIEPTTTESGSTETIVSGTTGTTESGSTKTESGSTETSKSESSQLESTTKQSTTELSSTRTTSSDSTEFSTTSIEPRTTESGSTESIVFGTIKYESSSTETNPVEGPAGISGTPNAVVVGEMGRSLSIRCLAYGYPQPAIYWYRGQNGPMVPYSSSLYEARGNVLQIRKLMPETLGEYTCQAYNGYGKPAEWAVVVQAYRPEGSKGYPYMVTRQTERSVTPYEYEPQTEPTSARTTEIEIPFSVPVRTRITTDRTRLSAGSEVNLPCDVDGFPVPEVYWTKDGVQIQRQPADDRINVTEARLTITRANTNDSGVYGCHANNGNTSDYSTVQISVEVLNVPEDCKDNPFFANCNVIVRSKFCNHKYYSKFCCKSCVEAGQLDPNEVKLLLAEMQAWRRKRLEGSD